MRPKLSIFHGGDPRAKTAMRLVFFQILGLFCFMGAQSALAQSFDCAKARSPVETAICGSSDLRTLDNSLAGAYARAKYVLREDKAALEALKNDQRAFLSARDKECQAAAGRDQCLARVFRARLDVLNRNYAAQPPAEKAPVAQAPVLQPSSAQTAAGRTPVPQTPVAPAPVTKTPAEKTPKAQNVAVAPQQADQANGAQIVPSILPADSGGQALATIVKPGRYAIFSQSATGLGIQLVDRIEGPGESSGAPGVRDGRIEALLDAGVYQIRATGAAHAQGQAQIKARAWSEIVQAPLTAEPVSGQLRDFEQASYWIDVGFRETLAFEAVGRNIVDLRVWRDDALIAMDFERAQVEPQPGRPMTRLRAEGVLEPGRYLATVYGGPTQVWAEGEAEAPFLLRKTVARDLPAHVFEGVIGPFGSEIFVTPGPIDSVRVETPQVVPLRVFAHKQGAGGAAIGTRIAQGQMVKNSRDNFVSLSLPKQAAPVRLEIIGAAGQPFKLNVLQTAPSTTFSWKTPTRVGLETAGFGEDELPATAILASRDKNNKVLRVRSLTPTVGPNQSWRRKFNLRGESLIYFQTSSAGPIAITLQGAPARFWVEPALGGEARPAAQQGSAHYDLEAGFYALKIKPEGVGARAVDLTLGPPGGEGRIEREPARSFVDLGVVGQEAGVDAYDGRAGGGPMAQAGLLATPLPADLSKAPFFFWQEELGASAIKTQIPIPHPENGADKTQKKPKANASASGKTQPVREPAPQKTAGSQARAFDEWSVNVQNGYEIVASDQFGAPVDFQIAGEKSEGERKIVTLRVARANFSRAVGRAVGIAQRMKTIAPSKQAATAPQAFQKLTLEPNGAHYFDLASGGSQEFSFDVRESGLYRLETFGRLATRIALGSRIQPNLGRADKNGAGANALLQLYLRAGAYRVKADALEGSHGRLALALSPARLTTTATLTAGANLGLALEEGEGAAIPIKITAAGSYRLDLLAPALTLVARLEDAQGWPLTPVGQTSVLDIDLTPGDYRLVIAPNAIATRALTRLTARAKTVLREGRGPHVLVLQSEQNHLWREPTDPKIERADEWTFELKGPAKATIAISQGMIADLLGADAARIGAVAHERPFERELQAGVYRLKARAAQNDDRLNYTLSVKTKELQPGEARRVTLPASAPFSIGQERIVNLTSFGSTPVLGVLKDKNNAVVARLSPRDRDWNLALARFLPAGAYTLDIKPLDPSQKSKSESGEASENSEGDESAGEGENTGSGEKPLSSALESGEIELRLALPESGPAQMGDYGGVISTNAQRTTTVEYPSPPKASLAAIAAQAQSAIGLRVEILTANGQWRTIGQDMGHRPIVVFPAPIPASDLQSGAQKSAVRLTTWSADGVDSPLNIYSAAFEGGPIASANGPLAFQDVAKNFGDAFPQARLARVKLSGMEAVFLRAKNATLLTGSRAGEILRANEDGLLTPQSEDLWIFAPDGAPDTVALASARDEANLSFVLAAGERAHLPASAQAGERRDLWIVRALDGQPYGVGDIGAALAPGAAAVLSAQSGEVWSADFSHDLGLAAQKIRLSMAPEQKLGLGLDVVVPAKTAIPIRLSQAGLAVDADLAQGLAIMAEGDHSPSGLFADGAPQSRGLMVQSARAIIANPTDEPAPASLRLSQEKTRALTFGDIYVHAGAGLSAVNLSINAQKGDSLRVSGAKTQIFSADGAMLIGEPARLEGPSLARLDGGQNFVAWIERDGGAPWSQNPVRAWDGGAQSTLEGPMQSFAFEAKEPQTLEATFSTPALAIFEQGARREYAVYPAGGKFSRAMAPGKAALRLAAGSGAVLSGALNIAMRPALIAREGMQAPVALGPGARATYVVDVSRKAEIGFGLRADPNFGALRLFDFEGVALGSGAAFLKELAPGRYFLEITAPEDKSIVARASVMGLDPPPTAPPQETIDDLLGKAGLRPGK